MATSSSRRRPIRDPDARRRDRRLPRRRALRGRRPAAVGERFAARCSGWRASPSAPGLVPAQDRDANRRRDHRGGQGRVDLETLDLKPVPSLEDNDVGDVVIALDRAVGFDPYGESRETGGFILIDRDGCDTVGIGLIREAAAPEPKPAGPEAPASDEGQPRWLAPAREKRWRSLAKAITWRTTGSLDTMLLTYLFTHDVRISAAVGLTEILTKCVLYYGHERIWARSSSGSGSDGAARVPVAGAKAPAEPKSGNAAGL